MQADSRSGSLNGSLNGILQGKTALVTGSTSGIGLGIAHALVASAQKSAYVAAKHGLVGLTKSTALECAATGVTANAICPGWVLTPLVQKQVDERAARAGISNEQAKRDLLLEKQPSGEF